MKQILITGGAGFIGSHLAELLLDRGQRVTVLDDESAGSADNLHRVASHFDFNYVRGSASDADLIRQLLRDVDNVYHLAAAVGVKRIADDPVDCMERLLAPTQVVLAELGRCVASGRQVKMFLASSSEVYGNSSRERCREEDPLVLGPTSESRWCYGASKAMDEFLALAYWRQHQLPVVIGRLFNVVGPRQSGRYGMVLPRFVENALAGKPPVVYDDGQQVRCFSHVTDVCEAMADLMDTDSAVGQVLNVGVDEPVTILEVAERVVAAVNLELDIEFESYRNVYGDDFRDVRRRVPDLSKLKKTIRHEPKYNLDLIIQDVIHWKRG